MLHLVMQVLFSSTWRFSGGVVVNKRIQTIPGKCSIEARRLAAVVVFATEAFVTDIY